MTIEVAARMAGQWWAERLDDRYADKRPAFAAAVEHRVRAGLEKHGEIWLENDYDPRGELLEAVRETVAPDCRGFLFSGDGILPEKHELKITPTELRPKEGYGNWTPAIPVPESAA